MVALGRMATDLQRAPYERDDRRASFGGARAPETRNLETWKLERQRSMLDRIVRYLHESLVPFRLSSFPSPERVPKAAQPIAKLATRVGTQVVLVGDKLAIVCFAEGDVADLSALSNQIGASICDATTEDLPEDLQRFEAAPPPLGQLFGIPVIIDERVTEYASIVMPLFGESDYLEIPYEDFARQEEPRVVSFARAGELPERIEEAAASAAPSVH